jgi:hypothetical protein
MITPNIWKNNPNVPNHQPVNIYVRLVKLHTIYTLLMVIPFHGNPNKMGILIMYKKNGLTVIHVGMESNHYGHIRFRWANYDQRTSQRVIFQLGLPHWFLPPKKKNSWQVTAGKGNRQNFRVPKFLHPNMMLIEITNYPNIKLWHGFNCVPSKKVVYGEVLVH